MLQYPLSGLDWGVFVDCPVALRDILLRGSAVDGEVKGSLTFVLTRAACVFCQSTSLNYCRIFSRERECLPGFCLCKQEAKTRWSLPLALFLNIPSTRWTCWRTAALQCVEVEDG